MDANNLRCFFVKQAVDYLDCLKYSVTCCPDDAKKYYLLYKLSESDCPLTPELECLLEETAITDYYVDCNAGSYVDPIGCYDQVSVDIDIQTTNCSFSGFAENPVVSGSLKPDLVLQNDEIYQIPTMNVGMLNSCTGLRNVATLQGNCTPSGCTTTNGAALYIGRTMFNNNLTPITSESLLRSITVYETDQFGQFVDTPIELFITDYIDDTVTCPGCTTIDIDHLKFSATQFVSAMTTLFNNISLARYGQTNKHQFITQKVLSSGGTVSSVTIQSAVKHNPADNWMGFNISNAGWTYFPIPDVKPTLWLEYMSNQLTYSQKPAVFYNAGVDFTTSCGSTVTVSVPQQQVTMAVMGGTNFYRLQLSPINPVNVSGLTGQFQFSANTELCQLYNITATVNSNATNANLVSVNWYDATDTLITPIAEGPGLKTIQVSEDGNYKIVVTLSNGCVIQYLVTMPEGTITQL